MIVQLILASRTGTRELEDEVSYCWCCSPCDHRSKWTMDNDMVVKEILNYGSRQRSTHCREVLLDTKQTLLSSLEPLNVIKSHKAKYKNIQLKNIHIFNGNDSVGCTFNIKWKGRVRWNNDLIWLGKQVSTGYGSESQSCKIGSIYLIKLEFDTGLRIRLI